MRCADATHLSAPLCNPHATQDGTAIATRARTTERSQSTRDNRPDRNDDTAPTCHTAVTSYQHLSDGTDCAIHLRMDATQQTVTHLIRYDIVKADNGTWSAVAVLTGSRAYWHNGFATKAEAVNFAKWSQ